MIDIRRRGFLFGVAATLVLPPERTFHILEPPKLIVEKPRVWLPGEVKLFDLPDQQARELGRKLVDGIYRMRDIPEWVVLDKQWRIAMLRQDHG